MTEADIATVALSKSIKFAEEGIGFIMNRISYLIIDRLRQPV